MKKIFMSFSVVIALFLGVLMIPSSNAYADAVVENAGNCGNTNAFFALRPWYYGLTTVVNGKCEVGKPVDGKLPQFIWTIVLNILFDITLMVGFIAMIMIAWGGYLYMFSRGMPDRAERGKKTLIAAVAGLAIAMLASVIMNTIVSILTNVA